ncbi:MAG: transcriptional regulator [Deltaproteobacteria bacterium]|nr:transcriptional regulator [Deltaproteobacteria bacterium]MBW1719629.1 transcriptional regulator [Deltaproteobacteria bacterium]MBW1965044.1 transcriptional regulator [Deltaproteobacteria bacterium]MBW2080865.1 transcriptional regulator [Deltaproteobacteria bacterium]
MPFPKNPVIARFFREIGRVDELGSGMRKLMKYGKAYGNEDPEMIEGDVFRIIVKVPEFGTAARAATGRITGEEGTKSAPSRHQVEILLNCQKEQAIGDLMKIADRSDRTKFRNQVLNPLIDAGWVEMTIPHKPTSSKQKYRLTNVGKHLLKSIQE